MVTVGGQFLKNSTPFAIVYIENKQVTIQVHNDVLKCLQKNGVPPISLTVQNYLWLNPALDFSSWIGNY